MKYIKLILVAIVFTFFLAITFANADGAYKSYVGISLPALKGDVQRGPLNKLETSIQHYLNTGNINACTGNENGVQVRVSYEGQSGAVYSSWLTIANAGQSGAWANTSITTTIRPYNIHIKNNTTSPCKSTHSGMWYLDHSVYEAVN